MAGRFGQRPAAPLGAPGELGPGGLGLCPGRRREKSLRLTGAGLLPAAAGRGVARLDVKAVTSCSADDERPAGRSTGRLGYRGQRYPIRATATVRPFSACSSIKG